ncbi:GPI transamidase component Gpi16 subunit family isoform 1 [Chlorella sorokiniana]|uniref:GPI transamidase component Gpi16 subunit family isoform 1 n=1 Tax=Chlorella sorokiniana TaxID=3076 RepID=A0A2P6TRE5_CHLSO|nr:GPI transamidase component Gpi16 subunit family isoform 1 [Chlorella sorokiniana]|eukprot:PRW56630.1 GPI transamidase component Gpi16 subunit family isoform 1 [Chlorella sorokiniana]
MLLQGIDGTALVHFEAVVDAPLHSRHAGSFPASLLALAREQGVEQLELSLTRGRWAWSQQQHAAAIGGSKPPGLELKVAFGAAVADTQAAYGVVTQALGGLLCAGVATAPQLAVMAAPAVGWFTHQSPAVADGGSHELQQKQQQDKQQQQQQASDQRQVYAWLPQEVVCSENLAAWRRLLPCRHQAGLAALLQPVQLAAASYVSLGLQLQLVPQPDAAAASSSSRNGSISNRQQPQVQLRLVLTALLPRPAAAEQQQQQERGLVEALFGCSLPAACPAAASSMLYVSPDDAAALGNSSGSCVRNFTPAGPLLACNLLRQRPEEVQVPYSLLAGRQSGSSSSSSSSHSRPVMQVVQHAIQRDSRAGTLVVGVRVPAAALQPGISGATSDSSSSSSGLLHVMQLVPWQLPLEAASLRLELNGQVLQGKGDQLVWQAVDARTDRTARIELLLRLPASPAAAAGSSGTASSINGGRQWHELTLSVNYSVAFVGVFDLPPDASRGIDIPPAVATLLSPVCANASALLASQQQSGGAADAAAQPPLLSRLAAASGCLPVQQYSGAAGGWGGPAGASGATGGGAVVPLPIPDLSMPFNVLCFTSTLLAVLFGGVANVVLRSPEELAGGGEAAGPGGTPRWKRKARRLVALLLLMGALAVYLDRDLQRQLDGALHHWVLGRTRSPEQHGEL